MNHLETFVKSKLLNHPKWVLPPKLSLKNMEYVKSLNDEIFLNKRGWKHCVISISKIQNIQNFINENKIRMLEDESMEFAKEAIETQLKYGYHCSIKMEHRIINVYICFPKYVGEEMLEKRYLWKIVVWLKTAIQYAKSKCSEKLDVYLFLTNLKKTLPTSQLLLNRNHVNTAFTTPCTGETSILLYRMEEWFKVFIHETMHCLGLDFSHMDTRQSNNEILKLFGHCEKGTDIRLSETYCEVWAELINILFFVMVGRKMGKTPKYKGIGNSKMNSKSKFKTLKKMNLPPKQWMKNVLNQIQLEQGFSIYQCIKVLKYNGLKYPELCNGHPSIPKYREETQVLSYYVLKGLLMYHVDAFLDWCRENNENTLQFTHTSEIVLKYVELVKSKYLEKGWLNNLDLDSKGIFEKSQKNDSSKSEKWIESTLRMSVTE